MQTNKTGPTGQKRIEAELAKKANSHIAEQSCTMAASEALDGVLGLNWPTPTGNCSTNRLRSAWTWL